MKWSCKCFQGVWLGAFFLCLLLTVWTGEKNNAFAAAAPSISQRIAQGSCPGYFRRVGKDHGSSSRGKGAVLPCESTDIEAG